MMVRNSSSLVFAVIVLSLDESHAFSSLTTLTKTVGPTDQFVGFDLGTSGVRISVIQQCEEESREGLADENEPSSVFYKEVYNQAIPWKDGAYDDANVWMESVESLLKNAEESSAFNNGLKDIKSICVSGTSASCLLVDGKNVAKPSRSPSRMYNFDVISSPVSQGQDPIHGVRAVDLIGNFAPEQHTARSATGSLAKLLSWHDEKPLVSGERLCHQADYIALRLMSDDKACGSQRNERLVCSDWHNCLKLGYDVRNLEFPLWLQDCLDSVGLDHKRVLPAKVVSPGEPMGVISSDMAKRLGLSEDVTIVGGTTDSNAAFFAATATDSVVAPGTAVVSLGSTLAIKQVSTSYVENANVGVYSHRYPSALMSADQQDKEAWLVGGASNVGCAVLRQEEFSVEELTALSNDIDPDEESPLDYYPLTRTGERFPIADGNMEPVLEPKPESRKEYLHGILQGISTVENKGFEALGQLGASPSNPKKVWTCGGGAQNEMWSKMRERRLREIFRDDHDTLIVAKAKNVEASYGAAVLATSPFRQD
uniref:Carbohydrate kinase FGGY C-terminal domain-containing protein n=1 Tax=Entomoneis paludosa TaxID=265537 RepID=A0A7S2Y8T5_9STRA|mmetsp:Transcript_22616/g.47172  ORF Transcript_22616/g.47172 Transcript_22616/m.47172 type:complete len:539 (+) Transcript_22616:81-1697(+)